LGTEVQLQPGRSQDIVAEVPNMKGSPIWGVGMQLQGNRGAVYLDSLDWSGAPAEVFERLEGGGTLWKRAWINGVDQFEDRWPEPYRIVQNRGTGLISQGTPDWKNYRVEAPVAVSLAKSGGIAARVQGLRRYYALLLCDDQTVKLVKSCDTVKTLAATSLNWHMFSYMHMSLEVNGRQLRAWIDGELVFAEVDDLPLPGGGVGLVVEEGSLGSEAVRVSPIAS
jgi:hypothetical protein